MRLPVTWLKTLLPKLPPRAKLVDVLMMHGLDVEEVIRANTFDHVVVGEIVSIKPHPNADKLRLADVVLKPNGSPQEIVCGAPNIEVGQKVPVALVGAKLPNGLTIEPRAIRGVTSNGMICAEDEMGLGASHAGVMILDSKLKPGTPLADVISGEEVIDVTTPANRADLMSMRGMAQEIGAILGQKPKVPAPKLKESKAKITDPVSVHIMDPKLCSLLTARVIRGIAMKPTPTVIVSRLQAAGMRSVNIVVDITNYVMLEYGQPLHAYDAHQIQGGKLIARGAKTAEHMVTLDGKMRQLTDGMLVIADEGRIVGLGGVMGGKGSGVSEKTTDLILEAAIFDPVSIRKTSRYFGLISEASKRFEKGLWPSLPEQASTAAAAMIVEHCGGVVEGGIAVAGKDKTKPQSITMNPAYISERLGMKVPVTKSKTVLTKLGFAVKGTTTKWTITVPEWRLDVTLPEDIVDEVGRMIGYEALPKEMPVSKFKDKELPNVTRFKEELRNILVDLGFTEIVSHAFYSDSIGEVRQKTHFVVANPLDSTQGVLRQSIRPQIESVLRKSAQAGEDALVFELGRVFSPQLPGPVENQQPWKLALGACRKSKSELDDYLLKLHEALHSTHPAESRNSVDDPVRGRWMDIAQFDIADLMKTTKIKFGPWDPNLHVVKDVKAREQSKYPAIVRDIAFWWSKDETAITQAINELGISMLREFSIKDRFTKDGRTSLTIAFVYQSPERTLTRAEVDHEEAKIKAALTALGAILR